MVKLLPPLLVALFPETGVLAQAPAAREPRPSIHAVGEATVMAKPDQAKIQIGVVTQAQTAQIASAQNAKQLDAVLAELRRNLGPSATLQTSSYSLHPNYKYPREGGQPSITGYTARNVVEVTLNDLGALGKLIDVVTQSGANTIQGLQFTLKDEQGARAQALKEAAVKARANAGAMASAMGVKITRVLSIQQGEAAIVRPVRELAMARMAEAAPMPPTPVEPGAIEVRATVTLVLEIAE